MAKFNFSLVGPNLVARLNSGRVKSFNGATLILTKDKIKIFEHEKYASAFVFTQIGSIAGETPVDIDDAFSKLSELINGDTPVIVLPNAPQNLIISEITSSGYTADADLSTSVNVDGYNIYEDTGSGFVKLNAELLPTPHYVKTGLTPETDVSCYFTAVDEAGNESEPGEVITFQTAADVPALEPWEEVLAVAQADGWNVLYNFDQPNTVTLNSGKVSAISDALGTLPNQVQATSANQPGLTANAIGQLDAAVFTGTQNLNIATATSKAPPVFVMAVFQYDGVVSSNETVFVFDGSTGSNARLAFLTANGKFDLFGSRGLQKSIAPLDNNPHIIGAQFTINRSAPVYFDGSLILYEDYAVFDPISLLRIGSDHLGARKWKGKIAAVAIKYGTPSMPVVDRMFNVLSTYSGIAKVTPPNTALGYATMRLSDGVIVNSSNPDVISMIASMTKVMTCLVAQDYITNYNTEITAVADDVNVQNVGVVAGDIVSYTELFAAAMIVSDDNATKAIARTVGYLINPAAANNAEATASFITKMNEKAALLGMTNTTYTHPWNFANSTPRDLTKLFKHIYDRPTDKIKEFWGLLNYTMTPSNRSSYNILSTSSATDRALVGVEYLGAKTGTWAGISSLGFIWKHPVSGVDYTTIVLGTPHPEGNRFYNARLIVNQILQQ